MRERHLENSNAEKCLGVFKQIRYDLVLYQDNKKGSNKVIIIFITLC